MDMIEVNGQSSLQDNDQENDDPFAVPPPLASFLDEDPADIPLEQNEGVNTDNVAANGSPQQSDETGRKKKRTARPRVNLNEERLCSNKGIPALKNFCSDVKFKGKGYEVSDLNKLLCRFEHWAQCLMPRWPFENVVRKCELLGTSRGAKNELKRLRRNEDDILRGEPEDDLEEETAGETEAINQGEPTTNGELTANGELAHPDVESSWPNVQQEERPQTQLTEEQLERIRRKREEAFAKREAIKRRKLAEKNDTQIPPQDSIEVPADVENTIENDSLITESSVRTVETSDNAKCLREQSDNFSNEDTHSPKKLYQSDNNIMGIDSSCHIDNQTGIRKWEEKSYGKDKNNPKVTEIDSSPRCMEMDILGGHDQEIYSSEVDDSLLKLAT